MVEEGYGEESEWLLKKWGLGFLAGCGICDWIRVVECMRGRIGCDGCGGNWEVGVFGHRFVAASGGVSFCTEIESLCSRGAIHAVAFASRYLSPGTYIRSSFELSHLCFSINQWMILAIHLTSGHGAEK